MSKRLLQSAAGCYTRPDHPADKLAGAGGPKRQERHFEAWFHGLLKWKMENSFMFLSWDCIIRNVLKNLPGNGHTVIYSGLNNYNFAPQFKWLDIGKYTLNWVNAGLILAYTESTPEYHQVILSQRRDTYQLTLINSGILSSYTKSTQEYTAVTELTQKYYQLTMSQCRNHFSLHQVN